MIRSPAQTYDITIDEDQRRTILAALALAKTQGIKADVLDSAEEVGMLHGLFEELPGEEAKTPGIHHGFCY